ncbi:MAG: hypothetical protein BMS9Abin02_0838 [Anaerolineae bacterium]|nr:MAG: hypothetical protein BMS9Abin02_0838 [Anaerolineae bacterium]
MDRKHCAELSKPGQKRLRLLGELGRDCQQLDQAGGGNGSRCMKLVRSNPGESLPGATNRSHGRRLTDQAVYNMLRKRAMLAGVSRLSPHDFRRTFAGDLLDRGADIVTVQKMAGHADPATTSHYDLRGERAQHKATSLLQVPYSPHRLVPEKTCNWASMGDAIAVLKPGQPMQDAANSEIQNLISITMHMVALCSHLVV